MLVPECEFTEAMISLKAKQTVVARIPRGGLIYQADVRMEGSDIVCSQTDISDLAGELEYRDSVFRRVCHDLRAPLHGIAGQVPRVVLTASFNLHVGLMR